MRERARNLRSKSELHLNNRCLFQLRGKVLGGASSINGMVYMRGCAGSLRTSTVFGRDSRTRFGVR